MKINEKGMDVIVTKGCRNENKMIGRNENRFAVDSLKSCISVPAIWYPCRGCPYAKSMPCIGFCIRLIRGEMRERRLIHP